MNKALEDRFLLTLIVAFCLLSFQFSSVEVSAELDDDVVVITVDSTNLKFSPNEVTINEGQTVRFFWSGEFLDHNAVAINGIFNSGEPEKEVDYSFTFDKGTNEIAKIVSMNTKHKKLVSVAGGGDTISALNNAEVTNDFTYVSTAGGAFLEWLEGKELPGISALHNQRLKI